MRKKMRAAFLAGPEKIEIREVTRPAPGPGEVLVQLTHTGVCGSDVHYFREGRIGEQVVRYPFIIGHETAGLVAGNGIGSNRFRPGDPVAVEPAVSCGRCPLCAGGRPNLCPSVQFLGTPPVAGAYREYLVMPEENLYPLPEGVSRELGALCEPLAVGLYAWELPRPRTAQTVAVFGCGPIGLSVIIAARWAGAATIIASDPIAARRALAAALGADHVIDPGRENAVEAAGNLTGGRGVDCAFEAAGEPGALVEAIEAAAVGGRVVIVGIPTADWTVPNFAARRKELVLHNVRRSAFTTERVIAGIDSGRIDPSGLVTHRFPLEKLEEALALAGDYRDGVVKAMVTI